MKLTSYLKTHPKKVLIFDFDNTLFHLELPWQEHNDAVMKIAGEYEPRWKDTKIDSTHFVNNYLGTVIEKHGDEVWKKITKYAAEFEREKLTGYQKNPPLVATLKKLSSNYNIYLWTSNFLATIEPILIEHDLKKHFQGLITRDKVHFIKPRPDGFDLIYKAEPLEKTEYVMIGDSNADKDAAASAGIDFFPITYFK